MSSQSIRNGTGGHSCLHYGRPSAIRSILELGTQIASLDMRSASPAALERLRRQVYDLVRLQEQKGLRYDVNIAGDRPAGAISDDHVLVQGALAALAEIGSTDGNVPLSQGCPAVTIGITRGGNAHRLDEFIEVQPVRSGMKQLITLTLAAASYYTGLQA